MDLLQRYEIQSYFNKHTINCSVAKHTLNSQRNKNFKVANNTTIEYGAKKERHNVHNKSNNSPRKGHMLLLLKKNFKFTSKHVN